MAAFKVLASLLVLAVAVSAQYHAGGFGGDFAGAENHGFDAHSFGGAIGSSGVGGGDHGHGGGHHEDYAHHHPSYKFEYAVHDGKTHDIKSHSEHRDGDKTEGEYSVLEADGTTRTVKYHVHGKSGFVATVHRSGHATHPQVHHAPQHHHFGGEEAGFAAGAVGGFHH